MKLYLICHTCYTYYATYIKGLVKKKSNINMSLLTTNVDDDVGNIVYRNTL